LGFGRKADDLALYKKLLLQTQKAKTGSNLAGFLSKAIAPKRLLCP
jgi:hypothetical protein